MRTARSISSDIDSAANRVNGSFTGPVLTIHVTNPEARTYTAHEALLTRCSRALQKAVRELGPACRDRHVYLDNVDHNAFNNYLNWQYRGAIYAADDKQSDSPDQSTTWPLLIRGFLLSIRLEDSEYGDAVSDAMITVFSIREGCDDRLPNHQSKQLLYANTVPLAGVRRMLVQMYAHIRDPVLLDDRDPPEFLLETSKAMMSGAAEDPLVPAARCQFHEHGDDQLCYRTSCR